MNIQKYYSLIIHYSIESRLVIDDKRLNFMVFKISTKRE